LELWEVVLVILFGRDIDFIHVSLFETTPAVLVMIATCVTIAIVIRRKRARMRRRDEEVTGIHTFESRDLKQEDSMPTFVS
jgi:hypothetical protein